MMAGNSKIIVAIIGAIVISTITVTASYFGYEQTTDENKTLQFTSEQNQELVRLLEKGNVSEFNELKQKMNLNQNYVSLEGAALQGIDLREINLERVRITNANLQNANLQGADLSGADLHGTNLKNAYLLGTNLSNLQNLPISEEEAKQRGAIIG